MSEGEELLFNGNIVSRVPSADDMSCEMEVRCKHSLEVTQRMVGREARMWTGDGRTKAMNVRVIVHSVFVREGEVYARLTAYRDENELVELN